jgi:hydroxyacylglutathione hydrolase
MRITPIPCLSDNYAYLLVCPETKEAAIVDVSEAGPVLRALEGSGKREREHARVVAILSTHHHYDHVGGNEEVAAKLGIARVYGHASDRGRIPGQTEFLEEGDTFTLGSLLVRALHIPGHTLGAVAYVVTREPHDPVVFTGDTLFVAGCGRLFEGDPPMMHRSLAKLGKLDGRTRVHCGHEYTVANLRFAKHVEPSNAAIDRAMARASALRAEGKPTVPSTIADELAHNPFLRVSSPEIRRTLGISESASPGEALGVVREAKNAFK